MQQQRPSSKRLAFARGDGEPSFEAVSQAAATAALCRMSVNVLCLTQEQLYRWRSFVDAQPAGEQSLRVHDLNRATLAEWQAAVAEQGSDMTVLAGFHTAQRRQEISADYASSLLDAVGGGLVVMA